MQTEIDPKKALMNKLMGPGIAPGEGAPNAGPEPAIDQPMGASPLADGPTQSPPLVDAAPGPSAPPIGAAPAAPDYTKRGTFGTFNANSDKYSRPWDQMSERYKMQTVLSNFDPSKGVTPEVLDALNKANINGATFSGGRDKLSANNLKAWEGYDGREGVGDVIQGFNDPNNTNKSWGAWQPDEAGPAAGGGAPAQGGHSGGPLSQADPLLSGDPMAKIQAALAQLSGPRSNAQELLQQLMGGGR